MSTVLGVNQRVNPQHHFNTATLTRERLGPVHAFQMGQAVHTDWEETEDGNILVRNFRVFKAGTFKDSMGEQRTWEREHLESMVFNYGLLKSSGRLTDIPVRDGHLSLFGSGGTVIGWHQEIKHSDGFIDVDFILTDEDGKQKWRNGTFRARSSEVGYYETNDEALYYPVYLGFAFVDIGAVEGLYEAAKQDPDKFTILVNDKENDVPPKKQTNHGGSAATPPGESNANTPDEGSQQQQQAPPPTSGQQGGDSGEEQQGGEQQQTPQQHSAPPQPFQFRVNGQPTNDFNAVQVHITAMEESLRDIESAARHDFVNELVRTNRLPAPQLEDAKTFVDGLTADQFEAYKKQFGETEVLPLLAQHGNGVTNPDGQQTQEASQVEIDLETVQHHRRSNLSVEKIRKTQAFQRLEAAGKAPALT
jgi:hypothetical protein